MLCVCFLTYFIIFKKILKLIVCLLAQDTFLSPTSGIITAATTTTTTIIIIIIII
jgi:hypothetical protein